MHAPTQTYNVKLAKAIGVKASILFCFILSKHSEIDEVSFIKLPVRMVSDELGLTDNEQLTALNALRKNKLIEKPILKGLPASRAVKMTNDFRSNLEIVLS